MFFALGVIAVMAALALVTIGTYNGLISRRNRYKNAYAQIDVQLKRRYDLIPNLVETVKGYMKHEADTLEAVIRARNAAYNASQRAAENAGDPTAMKALGSAETELTAGLSRMVALSEAYPELKASQNMRDLSEELTTTENRVAFARQGYNDCATAYNNAREMFPAVLLAGMFGFASAGLLEVIDSAEQRQAPKVSF
jgi:LemA protein